MTNKIGQKILLEIAAEIVTPVTNQKELSSKFVSLMEIISKELDIENEELDRQVVFSTFISRGSIFVTVFPHEGLDVPKNLSLPVVLEYGLNMANPIPDLKTDEGGIHATLSFNRTQVKTFVPWQSVGSISLFGFAIRWASVLGQTKEEEEVKEEVTKSERPRLKLV